MLYTLCGSSRELTKVMRLDDALIYGPPSSVNTHLQGPHFEVPNIGVEGFGFQT